MNRIDTLAHTCSTLTNELLVNCYKLYVKESPPRLCLSRGALVAQSLSSLKTMFLEQGAYTCWQCACPVFAARLLLHQHTLPATITALNLNIPIDCALFLRHTLLASSHPITHTIKSLLQATKALHLASLTREASPCGRNRKPPILLNNSWWVPFVATLPSIDPEFALPGQQPAQKVIWMYSAMSQLKAHKTNPPKGELTQKHPPNYKDNRFRAFLQSNVDEAIDNQRQANNLQPPTSPEQDNALTIDPLVITAALTATNAPYAYTLRREAITELRSAKSLTYGGEARNPTVKLNTEHV